MKNLGLFLITLLAVNTPLWADGDHPDMGRGQDGNHSAPADHPSFHANPAPASRPSSNAVAASRPAPSRNFNPVHIDLSHPGSGANNRNFQRPAPQADSQPVYGQVQWRAPKSNTSRTTTYQTHVYAGQ